MRAADAVVRISCPDWCSLSAQEHADDLWDAGGLCNHRSREVLVEDLAGTIAEPMADRHYGLPIRLELSHQQAPDGHSQGSPVVTLWDDTDLSLQQALELAHAIQRLVLAYDGVEGPHSARTPGGGAESAPPSDGVSSA